jgi:hypothetical protein
VSIQTAWQATFDFWGELPIVVEPSQAHLTSDAGLLPLRQFDEQIGLTLRFAEALNDPRGPERCDHSVLEMVRSRVYGVLAGYEDQNDHDALRHDPVFKLIANRAPDADPLASQPTLSRFENAVAIASLKRLRDVFIDEFIASFAAPPKHLVFDLDAVDDPAHGEQQLVLFHGYFDQYQYFPSFITCADNDQVVVLSLRPGAVHAALGCDDDLEHLVRRVRAAWPGVHIHVRGDAGYGMPWMYKVRATGLDYTFGIAANNVLKTQRFLINRPSPTSRPASRNVCSMPSGIAGTWSMPLGDRQAEANAQGTNRLLSPIAPPPAPRGRRTTTRPRRSEECNKNSVRSGIDRTMITASWPLFRLICMPRATTCWSASAVSPTRRHRAHAVIRTPAEIRRSCCPVPATGATSRAPTSDPWAKGPAPGAAC